MRILVTGGAGYIGSIVSEALLQKGHEVVVYDNLSTGHYSNVPLESTFIEGDILNKEKLVSTFRHHGIEAVMHFAAFSCVSDSVKNPTKYYRNNLYGGICLLEAMINSNVRKIVFSSTAAVYGEPKSLPITEEHPTCPINPYGEPKLAFENALKWFDKTFNVRFVSLRYFNAAGASYQRGEKHEPETHLIPLALQVALGKREFVEVFGNDYSTRDGTCIRDFIHVLDIAEAHVKALEILDEKSEIYNLGCGGKGFTVLEVIETVRKVTGREIKVVFGQRRIGDPAVLIASSEKIYKELGWQPKFSSIEKIVESAWRWMQRDESISV